MVVSRRLIGRGRAAIVAARFAFARSKMTDGEQQRVRFTPERHRREANRVRREAEATEQGAVRRQLLAVAQQFDAVAETMEHSFP